MVYTAVTTKGRHERLAGAIGQIIAVTEARDDLAAQHCSAIPGSECRLYNGNARRLIRVDVD